MERPLSNFLEFHPKEQRGILFLLVILFITSVVYIGLGYLNSPQSLVSEISESEFTRMVAAHQINLQAIETEPHISSDKRNEFTYQKSDREPHQDWPETSAAQKNHHWEQVDRRDWTDFTVKKKMDMIQTIEINSVDSIQLLTIKGIGPYTAHKILSYRNKLGGYVDTHQLLEIYKIDTTLFNRATTTFVCDKELIKPILLNTATYEEIARHPYIKAYQARALIAYRKMHGSFRTMQDLQNCAAMDEATCQRIAPYIRIE
jgi:DNA uptake protein ComE-like DNA-binding protein